MDKKVKAFMREMAAGKHTMAQSWMPKQEELRDFCGITLNKTFGGDLNVFVKALKDDVESQFHPVGCDTIRSVLDHEVGHQLDGLLGISDIPEVQRLFDSRTKEQLTKDLSSYSWDNRNPNRYGEMIAEAWSEYCNNPEPRLIAKTIGQNIEAIYSKKFGG